MATGGRLENLTAIAAGVTMRAKISSTPTTCTASVTATARMAMKAIDSAVTGTPLAPGQILVDRREEQGPIDRDQRGDRDRAGDQRDGHVPPC